MARVELNPAFETIRGSIGGMVIKRYGNKLVLSQKPVFRNRKFTKAQKQNQERFRRANAHATMVMLDAVKRKPFEQAAAETGKPVRSLIISEYMRTHQAE